MNVDPGTSARFRTTAKNDLRNYQLQNGQLSDLLKDLQDVADSESIDLGLDASQAKQSTYTIDGPFDADARVVISEVSAAWKSWEAAGRPPLTAALKKAVPPPIQTATITGTFWIKFILSEAISVVQALVESSKLTAAQKAVAEQLIAIAQQFIASL